MVRSKKASAMFFCYRAAVALVSDFRLLANNVGVLRQTHLLQIQTSEHPVLNHTNQIFLLWLRPLLLYLGPTHVFLIGKKGDGPFVITHGRQHQTTR